MNKMMKSYVWHKDKCFFVSTINRKSSAYPGMIYSETMVFTYDCSTKERVGLFYQGKHGRNDIDLHLAVCRQLHDNGDIKEAEKENARLKAALEPIREAWKTYRILEDSSESICWTQHCAIKRCMEILEKEEADV